MSLLSARAARTSAPAAQRLISRPRSAGRRQTSRVTISASMPMTMQIADASRSSRSCPNDRSMPASAFATMSRRNGDRRGSSDELPAASSDARSIARYSVS